MANTHPCLYLREIFNTPHSTAAEYKYFSERSPAKSPQLREHAQEVHTFALLCVFLWQNTAFQLQPLPSSALALQSSEQSASSYPSERRGTTCSGQHPCSTPSQVGDSVLTYLHSVHRELPREHNFSSTTLSFPSQPCLKITLNKSPADLDGLGSSRALSSCMRLFFEH